MGKGADVYFIINGLILSCVLFEVFHVNTRIKKRIMLFWSVFLSLFAGLRWGVGTDWEQYYSIFQECNLLNVFSYNRNAHGGLEWLFVFINAIIKLIFEQFWIYNLIICSFIQFTHYYVLKKICPNRFLLAYCILYTADTSYFAVRSQLGVAISMWLFLILKKAIEDKTNVSKSINKKHIRDYIKYFTVCYASFSVHMQSVLFFPIYWIGKIRMKWYICIGLLSSFFILSYVYQDYFILFSHFLGGDLGSKAAFYTGYEFGEGKGRGVANYLLDLLFLSAFLLVRHNTGKEKNEWYNLLLNIFILQSGILMIFSGGMTDLSRLAMQFALARALLIVSVIDFLDRFQYKLLLMISWAFVLSYLIYRYNGLDSWYYFYDTNVPYRTIFDYKIL